MIDMNLRPKLEKDLIYLLRLFCKKHELYFKIIATPSLLPQTKVLKKK